MKTGTANLLLLLAGAIWGFGFLAQKNAMDDIGPMLFVGLRFLLAAAAVLPLCLFELKTRRALQTTKTGENFNRAWLLRFVGLGFLFFAGMALQQTGLQTTSITNAGFLTTLYVVFTPFLSWVMLKEAPPKLIWPLACLSVAGVYLLSSGDLSALKLGDFLILAGAGVWAFHVIFVGRFSSASNLPYTMATLQFFTCGTLGCAAQILCSTLLPEKSWPTAQDIWNAAPEIVYAGLFSGAIAFTLQAVAQRFTSASIAAILMSSESLFAAILGAIFLNERLNGSGYTGCGLIFASIVTTEILSIRAERLIKRNHSDRPPKDTAPDDTLKHQNPTMESAT
ncbi:MAG: DMT family transporter [Fuerstiella sp.]